MCALIENVITNSDGKDIMQMRELSDFIPPDALSLFLAKKYMNAAIVLKAKSDKETQRSLCVSAHNEFMRYPLRVNLDIVLNDYLSVDMLLESVTLCLKVINTVDDIRRLAEVEEKQKDGEKLKKVLSSRLPAQDQAVKAIIEMLSQII